MENNKWIREYELYFAGPESSVLLTSIDQDNPLNIKFDISYDPKATEKGMMNLSIFGLSESNVAKISQPGVRVYFSVGYRGDETLARIFTGDIRLATVQSDRSKHETKLVCIASRIGSKPMMASFPKVGFNGRNVGTFTHADRIEQILDLCKELIPELSVSAAKIRIVQMFVDEFSLVELEDRDIIARTQLGDLVKDTFIATGSCLEALEGYCETFGIGVVIENDRVLLVREGGKFDLNQDNFVQAGLGENLLTPPRRKLDNTVGTPGGKGATQQWEMKMLLEPLVTPNKVVVSNYVRNDEGTVEEFPLVIKVSKVKHTGEYRANAWYTDLTGAVSQDFLPKDSPITSVAAEYKERYIVPAYGK